MFTLDNVKYSQGPDELQVSGVSKPSNTDFSDQDRETNWKGTSIKRIGQTIADRYGLGYKFDAEDIGVESDEQDGPDSTYLNGLCKKYGLVLKVYANKIWIYDREKYKKLKPIKTYTKETMKRGSFSYNTSLLGAYTGGVWSYTDPDTEEDIYCQIGTGPKIKNMSKRATSVADAAAQLCAELNNDNHSVTTIQFSVDGEWLTSAGNNIELKGYGKLDGIYFVDKITHKINKSGGFVSALQCSKVRDSFNPKDIGGPPEPPEEEKPKDDSGELKQGTAIKLDKANLYVASTSKKRACRVSGTYYLYDGELIAGRYRITNTPSRCGKKPVGHNVTGWVDKDACVIA